MLSQGLAVPQAQVVMGMVQAWEQANLMEEMWTEENAQLRAALEVMLDWDMHVARKKRGTMNYASNYNV